MTTMELTAKKYLVFTGKSDLYKVTYIYGSQDSGYISNDACGKSMPHFFNGCHTKIKCQHVKNGFTAADHNRSCTTYHGIGTRFFHYFFNDYKRAAAGNGSRRIIDINSFGYAQQIEKRLESFSIKSIAPVL